MIASSRRRDLLAVFLLGGVVSLFFWKLLFTNLILGRGDVFFYFYPYWSAAADALRSGRLPLWNPELFMGAPFLANSQAGVLYPLNWPLWIFFDTPTATSASIMLHLWLAAGLSYGFARSGLRMQRPAAWLVAILFALGGYLTAQVEHLNQLQGLAWLPAVFWLLASRERPARPLFLGGVFGLQLLAGHTQAAFITLVGASAYALWLSGPKFRNRIWPSPLVHLVLAGLIALLLTAAQLLPTLELSQHSLRGNGGLSLNEAVSFSLHPLLVGRALLPGYGETIFSEYVAYSPLLALFLAIIGTWAGRRNQRVIALALVGALGLFFALGAANPAYILLVRVVPAFALFRAPARWLVLPAFSVAGLAGVGLEALLSRQPWPCRRLTVIWGLVALGLIVGSLAAPWLTALIAAPLESPIETPSILTLLGWFLEIGLVFLAIGRASTSWFSFLGPILLVLFFSSRALPYNQPTAPDAYHALRPATAFLKSAAVYEKESPGPPGRFLSISKTLFDPGDAGELDSVYADQLDAGAFADLITASKQKEILAPNLPLAYGVPAVDGYDGGVLPLASYVTLEQLLLPADSVSMDGRLRENLEAIPEGRWLDLFNVRYLITDKVGDAWSEGVFYDLQHSAILDAGNPVVEVAYLPTFEATGLGIAISHARLPAGTALAEISVWFSENRQETLTLQAETNSTFLRNNPDGTNLKIVRLDWSDPGVPTGISIARCPEALSQLQLHGLSLVDKRDGAFQSLVVSDQGPYRLIHSGDVKIYENLDALPRAFLVSRAIWMPNEEAAVSHMQSASFDPAGEVVLLGERSVETGEAKPLSGKVTVTSYRPEAIELIVEADKDGWLVLSDAYYPGWNATVNGQPLPIERANILFRAMPIQAGSSKICLEFRPQSFRAGLLTSELSVLLYLVILAFFTLRPRSDIPADG